ncbi:2Fe-2S iron-sulfur cluster-binding protein [Ponticoccus litoralis]|uniref:2Fe-2S iron-sulfur cluster-binding protein n=1 Tax=Ponticoccus litoralis TaxID=422297 RepID=A0AAW9SVK8_9RHOB
MPTVTFITPSGASRTIQAKVGNSLMETARDHGVDGIVAECGGACACSTCHVFLEPEWCDKVPPVAELEADLLEFTSEPATEYSRLSCQIRITDALEGLTVRISSRQK